MTPPWLTRNQGSTAPLLKYLFEPIDLQVFLGQFWAKRPLYVAGDARKFEGLFSRERLLECLTRPDSGEKIGGEPQGPAPVPKRIRASYDRGMTHLEVSAEDASGHFDRGATLCIDGLEIVDRNLAEVAATVKKEMKFTGSTDVRVYWSPDKQGFENHFDGRVATTLQIEGSKRWTYSEEPAIDWPNAQAPVGFDVAQMQQAGGYKMPGECTFSEVVLTPGDLLCLPAGCWHSAQAIGSSLALNLAFSGTGSFWGPVLMSILSVSSVLRSPAPPVLGLESPTDVPPVVEAFLQEGIDELLDTLAMLKESDECLRQRWLSITQSTSSDALSVRVSA